MDVTVICSAREVKVKATPTGVTLPEAATATGAEIETLGELVWALENLNHFSELSAKIRGVLGQSGQAGSLNNHAWDVWSKVTSDLVAETGVVENALPIERIVQKVIERLTAEKSNKNTGDLVKLEYVLGLLNNDLLRPFFRAVESADQYPVMARIGYAKDRSFKINIKNILEQLVAALPEKARNQIKFSQINWTALSAADVAQVTARVNDLLKADCASYAAAIPDAPQPAAARSFVVKTPEQRQPFHYGLTIMPAYSLILAGPNDAPVESGPALHGRLTVGFDLGASDTLQLHYQPYLNVSSDFTSRLSQDAATLSFAHRAESYRLIGQGAYLWDRNMLAGQSEHLGAAGVGAEFAQGLFYPFAGGIFGTAFGGYGGVRSTYNGEQFGLSGQLFYSYAQSQQVGGSIMAGWRPFTILGDKFTIGPRVGANYDVDARAVGVSFGLSLGLTGDLLTPQPIRWGGF